MINDLHLFGEIGSASCFVNMYKESIENIASPELIRTQKSSRIILEIRQVERAQRYQTPRNTS